MITKRSSFPMHVIFGACVLLILAVLTVPVSAAVSQSTVAQGDTLYVSGQAPGARQAALYFFGPNYFKYAAAEVNGGVYTYQLDTTSDMSPSQYFCVVQSPGTGSRFSVGPLTVGDTTYITVNPGDGVPAEGSSFVVQGPNALQGSQAAYALENMLRSPNIPDLSQTFTFRTAYPLITIDPVEPPCMGSSFVVSGTTNLAVGDTLFVDVTVFSFWPMSKEEQSAAGSSSWSQGTSGQTTILAGSSAGQNVWSYLVDPLRSSEYEVTVTGVKTGVGAVRQFVVSNQTEPAAVPATGLTTAAATAEATVPTPGQSSGFGILSVIGMLGAVLLIAKRF